MSNKNRTIVDMYLRRGNTATIYLELRIYPTLLLRPERQNMSFFQITANSSFP